MELLDVLEARVGELVAQAQSLRADTIRLQTQAAQCRALQDENHALQTALIQEQRLKDAVLMRIDALLERLKDVDCDG